MPERVEAAKQISLNGVRYTIVPPIRSAPLPSYAPKVVIGDTTKDTHEGVSVVTWNDWRAGIGLEVMDGTHPEEANRCWWSELHLRHKGHLVLPPLATQTAASGASGSFDVGFINEYASVIYAGFGTDVRTYNNTTDAWTNVRTLAAIATHSLNVFLDGVEYLVVAQTSDYDYYNGTSWARSTKDAKFLAFWDERLWGIDEAGQLWWAAAPGTEEDDAQLQLPSGNVNALFVGRSPDGELILYCATTYGLYAHDFDNRRFVETELALPLHPDTGRGALRWRDSTYFPAGLPIYRYVNGENRALVTVMGPDRDGGLPSNRRGRIKQLVSCHNDLIALIDATTAPSALVAHQPGWVGAGDVAAEDSGFSHILGWDEKGWHSLWVSGDATKAITVGHISNSYGAYRLWWGHNEFVYWQTLPREINNPDQLTTQTYHAGPRVHETPRFDAGERHIRKAALRLVVETAGCSSTETVVVAYRIDQDVFYTVLGTIVDNGVTTYLFPNSTTPTGTAFHSIQFEVVLSRGATTTNTPDVRQIEFHFRKKMPTKWSHEVVIDLRGDNQEALFESLRAAVESETLVEYTHRSRTADDAGNNNVYNYYVDVEFAQGQEQSGDDWDALVALKLVER